MVCGRCRFVCGTPYWLPNTAYLVVVGLTKYGAIFTGNRSFLWSGFNDSTSMSPRSCLVLKLLIIRELFIVFHDNDDNIKFTE